eukprot:3016709-Alexandrium_andersonii.AAC.1
MPPPWARRQRSAHAAGATAVLTLHEQQCWNGTQRQRCPAASRMPAITGPAAPETRHPAASLLTCSCSRPSD